jgi:hypothetical protein
MAASADTLARFQHDEGETGMLQCPRRTEASGAGTDDGDIDFGDQGMLTKTLVNQALIGPAAERVLPPTDTTGKRRDQTLNVYACSDFE